MGYPLSELNRDQIPKLLEHIQHQDGWTDKASRISEVWKSVTGPIPETVPVNYTIHSTIKRSNYMQVHLSYRTAFNDEVTAYLLIPGEDEHPKGAMPAILALHPTNAAGKDSVGQDGKENRKYGYELVQEGYVVLAPDTITAGERIYPESEAFQTAPFYQRHPGYTAVGKMIHDHQQGIDVLTSFDYVDAERIGAIGHSLGAYNAFFLSAVDERVKAVVSSCGFAPFADDPNPNRWGQRDWFSHFPELTEAIERDEVPFEFHEILALTAPRPVFNWFGQRDHIFPNWQAAAAASLDVAHLYDFLGFTDHYVGLTSNSGHDFPDDIRKMAYRFFAEHLSL